MSNLLQFMGGNKPPKNIINGCSASGYAPIAFYNLAVVALTGALSASLSGALTANTLKSVLSVAGSGVIGFLGITSVDATARTHRMQLTIDGVVVFDSTSASGAVTNSGGWITGQLSGSAASPVTFSPGQLHFKTSFDLKIASSITETDKFNIFTNYYTA